MGNILGSGLSCTTAVVLPGSREKGMLFYDDSRVKLRYDNNSGSLTVIAP